MVLAPGTEVNNNNAAVLESIFCVRHQFRPLQARCVGAALKLHALTVEFMLDSCGCVGAAQKSTRTILTVFRAFPHLPQVRVDGRSEVERWKRQRRQEGAAGSVSSAWILASVALHHFRDCGWRRGLRSNVVACAAPQPRLLPRSPRPRPKPSPRRRPRLLPRTRMLPRFVSVRPFRGGCSRPVAA